MRDRIMNLILHKFVLFFLSCSNRLLIFSPPPQEGLSRPDMMETQDWQALPAKLGLNVKTFFHKSGTIEASQMFYFMIFIHNCETMLNVESIISQRRLKSQNE